MRNLKRVLSLALASVMLLGMMVIGAGAVDKTYADLTDSDKISNQEAVSLMVDIGIIEGKPDGSYAPTETVDRATMAKLITMMLMGDVDQTAFEGTVTDLTDIDSSWAEGYIKYCYANDIITGDGQGHFFPTEPVTVAQAAKMLLVAIGYDATDRGYQNDANWSTNIMRDAQTTLAYDNGYTTTVRSLTKGLSVKATDPLTRDNAAQMIFNALFVQTVEPEYQYDMGSKYIAKYNAQPSLAATTYNGLSRKSGVLESISDGTATIGGAPVKVSAKTGDIGTTVAYYVDAENKVVSSAVVASNADVLATSTAGVAYADLTTKGNKAYIGYGPADTVAYYYNGTPVTEALADKNDNAIYVKDATKGLWIDTTKDIDVASKVGVTVEFLDTKDSDGKYDVVKYTEYSFSQVTATTAEKADGTEATVTIGGMGKIEKSKIVGDFANLAEDDYVLCAKIGEMYYVYEPETFVGQMTAYNASKKTMTISGTTYSMADTADIGSLNLKVGASELTGIAAKKDATFYVDTNGYVVAAEAVSAEVNYAVIDKIALINTSGTAASKSIEAVLVFTDGTTETVEVSKINGTKASSIESVATGSLTVSDSTVTVKVSTDVNQNSALTGMVVSYSVNDGKYELTYQNVGTSSIEKTGTVSATGAVVTKGVPAFKYGNSSTANANNNTKYVIKTGTNNYTFASYTGFQNVPTTTLAAGGSATVSYVTDSNGAVTFVYISATGDKVTSGTAKAGDMAFVTGSDYTTDNSGSSTVYIFDAIVNGEETTVSTKSTTVCDALTAGKLYELTVKDGYVTDAKEQLVAQSDASDNTTFVKSEVAADAKDGVLDGYTYSGSETVIVIDSDYDLSSGTVESAKDGDTIYVKVVGTNTPAEQIAIDTIYIVKAAD